jgi:hypothetical protein
MSTPTVPITVATIETGRRLAGQHLLLDEAHGADRASGWASTAEGWSPSGTVEMTPEDAGDHDAARPAPLTVVDHRPPPPPNACQVADRWDEPASVASGVNVVVGKYFLQQELDASLRALAF